MSIFEHLDETFEYLKGHDDYAKYSIVFATTLGAIIIIYYVIKIIAELCVAFRLYVWCQTCSKGDLKRYGQWVLISGATDGIGLGMAKEFARRGHSILVVARNKDKLARTKELLKQINEACQVETVKIDFSDSRLDNYDRIKRQIDPEKRDIGILINNVGIIKDHFERFNRSSPQELLDIVNVNILAAIQLTRMIMPGMLERGRGLIVNNSSFFAEYNFSYSGLYGQTKNFINRFTESLQTEYSKHPVDIILMAPGTVYTNMLKSLNSPVGTSWIVPTADDFATSAVNCFHTKINKISGTAIHGFADFLLQISKFLGIKSFLVPISSVIFPETASISPVMKRKNQESGTVQAT